MVNVAGHCRDLILGPADDIDDGTPHRLGGVLHGVNNTAKEKWFDVPLHISLAGREPLIGFVLSSSGVELIVALGTLQQVVAIAAHELIVTRSAVEPVVVRATRQEVV